MDTVRVAITKFAPLIGHEGGTYTGFEIELWEAIAKELGVQFEYEEHAFQELIPLVASKQADVALAGITITEQRERSIDFSYPTLDSGLMILVHKTRNKIRLWDTIKYMVAEGYKAMLFPLAAVLGFIVVFAHLLFWSEENARTFSPHYFPGIFESAWLVICSMSTDSFGDYVPHTWLGRIVTIGIIVGGVAIFGLLIAQITALIAIKKIKGDIANSRDLAGKLVSTIKDSTSVPILRKIGATVVPVVTLEDAYAKLHHKEVDALVFDAPVLTYFTEHGGASEFELVGELFAKQAYGVALQSGSPWREPINQALLKLRESGAYDALYRKWFGEDISMES